MQSTGELDYTKAPEKGYLLIYFSDGVEFQAYQGEELKTCLDSWAARKLLEAHFFDTEKEYRWLYSRRQGVIEKVIEGHPTQTESVKVKFDGKEVDLYQFEEVVKVVPSLAKVMPQIRLVNYLDYNENHMLIVKGYRLAALKKQD